MSASAGKRKANKKIDQTPPQKQLQVSENSGKPLQEQSPQSTQITKIPLLEQSTKETNITLNSNSTPKQNNNNNDNSTNIDIVEQQQQQQQQLKQQEPIKQRKISTAQEFGDFQAKDFIKEGKNKFTDDYILHNKLGDGGFGEVYKVEHRKTGILRAVKIVNKKLLSNIDQIKIEQEVNILRELDHPNIIRVYEFYQTERSFYIITELCSGGELFDRIVDQVQFSEVDASKIIKSILSAINYCHMKGIMHRDLKPENVLFVEKNNNNSVDVSIVEQLKIIDFGFSIMFDPGAKQTRRYGTPYYIAPEVLINDYNEKCDIWSCGVISYILLCGYPPFDGENDLKILKNVKEGKFTFPKNEWNKISQEAKNFISKCLEYDPNKRYSSSEALNDSWIQKNITNTQYTLNQPLTQSVFNNLKTFKNDQKLANATMVFLASFMSTKEEKDHLLQIFQVLDQNGDGLLSKDELVNGYKSIMDGQDDIAEDVIQSIMNTIDTNKSGLIDYSEFIVATIDRKNLFKEERLVHVFEMFDKDGSGEISAAELKEFFMSHDCDVNEDVWTELIQEVDEDGNGEISYQEFKQMMHKLL